MQVVSAGSIGKQFIRFWEHTSNSRMLLSALLCAGVWPSYAWPCQLVLGMESSWQASSWRTVPTPLVWGLNLRQLQKLQFRPLRNHCHFTCQVRLCMTSETSPWQLQKLEPRPILNYNHFTHRVKLRMTRITSRTSYLWLAYRQWCTCDKHEAMLLSTHPSHWAEYTQLSPSDATQIEWKNVSVSHSKMTASTHQAHDELEGAMLGMRNPYLEC